MKEYARKPGNTSRTINRQPEASRQAPADSILQRYEESIQRTTPEEEELLQGKFDTAQREEIDEEELLQGKFETVQREEIEEEDLLQGKFDTTQREGAELSPSAGKVNNTGLPDDLKTGIENLSGYSMDDVKVHYNSPKPTQLQALAYAQGADIHIAPGQEKHLPHEAWHVVQQKQGRVQPTMQMQGISVNDNEGLEREADVMGGEAVQLKQIALNYNVNHNADKKNSPIQLLSEISLHDWRALMIKGTKDYREDIASFPDFAEIVPLVKLWDGFNVDDNYEKLKRKIKELGENLLNNKDDIRLVFEAVQKYFEGDLTMDDISNIKKYNFDGPIVFTAENAIAWLRLSRGEGLVDDIRYIKHELFEINQLKDKYSKILFIHNESSDDFWAAQDSAHQKALLHEIDFLIAQLKEQYGQEYTRDQVASSDKEREDDFGLLLGVLKRVDPVSELTERLTKLKQQSVNPSSPQE